MAKIKRPILIALMALIALMGMTGCIGDKQAIAEAVDQFWLGWSGSDPNLLDGLFTVVAYMDGVPNFTFSICMFLGDPDYWTGIDDKSFVPEEPAISGDTATVKAKMVAKDAAETVVKSLDLEIGLVKNPAGWQILTIDGLDL